MQPSPYAGGAIPGFEALIHHLGWPDLKSWQSHWERRDGLGLARHMWPPSTAERWITAVALPFLNLVESAAAAGETQLIGLSALPGCGKSTLGAWLEAAALECKASIAVVSLDDFYWPAEQLETCMRGNPWDAPRGLPGSHDLALLQDSLDRWQSTGILRAPCFERSLRDGRGDRAGWRDLHAQVVVLEGWFIGVDPWSPKQEAADLAMHSASALVPTPAEIAYRPRINAALHPYSSLWDRMATIWHLKAPDTQATVMWKEQQDASMLQSTGIAMEATMFRKFLRMLQLAILPSALQSISRAEIVIQIDAERQVESIAVANLHQHIPKNGS